MAIIDSEEALRAIIGEEVPGIGAKNIDHLDDYAVAFIQRSPFLILSASDVASTAFCSRSAIC